VSKLIEFIAHGPPPIVTMLFSNVGLKSVPVIIRLLALFGSRFYEFIWGVEFEENV